MFREIILMDKRVTSGGMLDGEDSTTHWTEDPGARKDRVKGPKGRRALK